MVAGSMVAVIINPRVWRSILNTPTFLRLWHSCWIDKCQKKQSSSQGSRELIDKSLTLPLSAVNMAVSGSISTLAGGVEETPPHKCVADNAGVQPFFTPYTGT
jgi:hypothetical protein